jgi:hypothetical protein
MPESVMPRGIDSTSLGRPHAPRGDYTGKVPKQERQGRHGYDILVEQHDHHDGRNARPPYTDSGNHTVMLLGDDSSIRKYQPVNPDQESQANHT